MAEILPKVGLMRSVSGVDLGINLAPCRALSLKRRPHARFAAALSETRTLLALLD
jgi:hypothetical protein